MLVWYWFNVIAPTPDFSWSRIMRVLNYEGKRIVSGPMYVQTFLHKFLNICWSTVSCRLITVAKIGHDTFGVLWYVKCIWLKRMRICDARSYYDALFIYGWSLGSYFESTFLLTLHEIFTECDKEQTIFIAKSQKRPHVYCLSNLYRS